MLKNILKPKTSKVTKKNSISKDNELAEVTEKVKKVVKPKIKASDKKTFSKKVI